MPPKTGCSLGPLAYFTGAEMTREALEKILMTQIQDLYPHKKHPQEILVMYDDQRALIEQQAGVIQRQWDYIAQLKQTISVHEQAGLEGLVRDYNDHQRIEQQAKEIANLKAEGLVSESMIDDLIKQEKL